MSPRVVVLTAPAPFGAGLEAMTVAAGDVVLDLDRLIPALGPPMPRHRGHNGTGREEVATHLRHVALGAFSSALERASHLREDVTVWVLHPNPTAAQVNRYRERGFEVRGS
ncbi:MAG: hypothetical protein ACJ8LL_14410 [Candidatus Udaeobacter sp.]